MKQVDLGRDRMSTLAKLGHWPHGPCLLLACAESPSMDPIREALTSRTCALSGPGEGAQGQSLSGHPVLILPRYGGFLKCSFDFALCHFVYAQCACLSPLAFGILDGYLVCHSEKQQRWTLHEFSLVPNQFKSQERKRKPIFAHSCILIGALARLETGATASSLQLSIQIFTNISSEFPIPCHNM